MSSADARTIRKELARIDRRLAKVAQLVTGLHVQLAAQSTDFLAVTALDAELRTLAAEREELEEQWLGLADSA